MNSIDTFDELQEHLSISHARLIILWLTPKINCLSSRWNAQFAIFVKGQLNSVEFLKSDKWTVVTTFDHVELPMFLLFVGKVKVHTMPCYDLDALQRAINKWTNFIDEEQKVGKANANNAANFTLQQWQQCLLYDDAASLLGRCPEFLVLLSNAIDHLLIEYGQDWRKVFTFAVAIVVFGNNFSNIENCPAPFHSWFVTSLQRICKFPCSKVQTALCLAIALTNKLSVDNADQIAFEQYVAFPQSLLTLPEADALLIILSAAVLLNSKSHADQAKVFLSACVEIELYFTSTLGAVVSLFLSLPNDKLPFKLRLLCNLL